MIEPKEYIKKYGIRRAKIRSKGLEHVTLFGGDRHKPAELKRLIESHELVERSGGLERAKEHTLVLALIEEDEQLKRLQQAIADVESCR